MNEFIALFGGVTIADIVFVGCAVGFLAGIFHKVSKYFKNKVLKETKKMKNGKK